MFRQKFYIKRIIRLKIKVIILINITMKISIDYHDNLFNDRDFLFELQCVHELKNENEVFVYIMNSFFSFVQLRNAIIRSIILFKRVKLKSMIEYKQKNVYLITSKFSSLVTIK